MTPNMNGKCNPEGLAIGEVVVNKKLNTNVFSLVSNKHHLGNLHSISDLKLPLKRNLIGYQSTGSNEIDEHTSL